MAKLIFVGYLLIRTNIFGFINANRLTFFDVPINVIADIFAPVLALVVSRICIESKRKNYIVAYLIFLLLYFCWSYFATHSSIVGRIPRLSDHLSLISGLLVTFSVSRRFAKHVLLVVLVLSSCVFLLHSLLGVDIGYFRTIDGIEDSLKFESSFLIYLFLAYRMREGRLNLMLMLLLFSAIFFSGFRSIFFAAVIAYLYVFWSRFTKDLRLLVLSMVLFLSPSVLRVVSADTAITSRLIVNLHRFDLLVDKPFLGYGFVSKTSDLHAVTASAALSRFDSTVNVVDAGVLDVLLRFGILGGIIYVFLIKNIVFGGKAIVVELFSGILLVCITLSVLTYSFGLSSLGIIGGIMRTHSNREYA